MLFELAQKNIEHGGRGIGNIIEERIVNPLARKLFDDKIEKGHSLAIKGIQTEREGHYSLITI